MVPHSHTDMGWIKTISMYFTGGAKDTSYSNVNNVYDGIFDELQRDPKRKFTIATVGYIKMWYNQQSKDNQQIFKKMI